MYGGMFDDIMDERDQLRRAFMSVVRANRDAYRQAAIENGMLETPSKAVAEALMQAIEDQAP